MQTRHRQQTNKHAKGKEEGTGHKWKSTIYARTKQNSSCPYCSGREISPEQSIAVTHKHIIDKEWDYVNNKNIKPELRELVRLWFGGCHLMH